MSQTRAGRRREQLPDNLNPMAQRFPDNRQRPEYFDWANNRLIAELERNNLQTSAISVFRHCNIEGKDIPFLNVTMLEDMGQRFGNNFQWTNDDYDKIQKFVNLITKRVECKINRKVYNDAVHGNIQIHPACQLIIDTAEFQRLRHLKQMGMVCHVYPGAVHTRFEHSLGVCYLAGEFARLLRQNQPFLDITDKDILCVEIAGLCHDLGHGPFSHTFDDQVIPHLYPEGTNFKHEQASKDMFSFLLEKHNLMNRQGQLRNQYGLDLKDITFIKEMIFTADGEERRGRPKYKSFLYQQIVEKMEEIDVKTQIKDMDGLETDMFADNVDSNQDNIVSNKENGVDVDKFDYFARDCHHLGIKNNFDHHRFMMFARVIYDDSDKKWHICVRDKELLNLYNMYFTRYTLQKFACQHRVNQSIELMLTHALVKANSGLRFQGSSGNIPLRDCINDMQAFSKLNDDILSQIRNSEDTSGEMGEAKALIERIFSRELYPCVYEMSPITREQLPAQLRDRDRKDLEEDIKDGIMVIFGAVRQCPFDVKISSLDMGRRNADPLRMMKIYSKKDPNKATIPEREAFSKILAPVNCSEILIRVFMHEYDPVIESQLKEAVISWKRTYIKDYLREEREAVIYQQISSFFRERQPTDIDLRRVTQAILNHISGN